MKLISTLIIGNLFTLNLIAQLTKYNYWDILPSEPRLRWSPNYNPQILTDWQLRYEWTKNKIKLGGVWIEPEQIKWQPSEKLPECQKIESNVIFDTTKIYNCPLEADNASDRFVLLNGRQVGKRGTLIFEPKKVVQVEFLLTEIKRKLIVEIQAPRIEMVDFSFTDKSWQIILQNQNFKPNDLSFWDFSFPFKEKQFVLISPLDENLISLEGFLGMKYLRLIENIEVLPVEQINKFKNRPEFSTSKNLITYSEQIQVPFQQSNDSSKNINYALAKNLKINQWNEVTLPYKETVLNYHVLRMPKYEASARASFLITDRISNPIPIQEFALIGNSENLLSDKFEHYLTHRLGWRIRALQSSISENDFYNIQLSQIEARWFLQSGVWNIEQTFGVLGALYQFKYNGINALQPGVGLFWGRSLPHVFDRMLRWMPWFKYPKYVDMDLNYIPKHSPYALDNYILNFHGKMFFPNQLFIEGGISVFRFSAYNNMVDIKSDLVATSGTLGIGYMF